jgi:hypothetical protein
MCFIRASPAPAPAPPPPAPAASAATPDPEPVIQVTIGRVEVRAIVSAPAAAPARAEPPRVGPPLEDYLANPGRFR